ncbi:MAG TPA: hypothetical protein EYP89_00960, partial [Candidatus Omnitrophica bacterium]|nr:hypothetical protein [Candidatus Omnitrophota bacterium]
MVESLQRFYLFLLQEEILGRKFRALKIAREIRKRLEGLTTEIDFTEPLKVFKGKGKRRFFKYNNKANKKEKTVSSSKTNQKDGGKNLNIPSLKQIAFSLWKGEDLLKGEEDQRIWHKIATDEDRSRLGFVLDISPSDLEVYLSGIKPYLEDKKAIIFVGMGGSINTIKIMKKILQKDKEIIFIDTPDEAMIEKLIKDLQNKGVSLKEIEIIAISKSATTFETHTIVNILKKIYTQNQLNFVQNLIWLIDLPNKDKLKEKGQGLDKLTIFPIQIDKNTDIGGRYTAPKTSLFILPLFILLGYDINKTKEVLDYIKELENTKSFQNKINDYINLVVKEDKVNPRVYIVLPQGFKPIYEEITIWITQLYQESLGGKVDKFDPKVIVLLENQLHNKIKNLLRKHTIVKLDYIFLDEAGENLIKKLIYLFLSLEYIVSGVAYLAQKEPFNFVTQPNVDEYKKIMKEIEKEGKELEEPEEIDLSSLTSFIETNLDKNQKFVEIIYYGTDENIYRKLKSINEINERFVLVFKGPDWNHHSFQAAFKSKNTLFVLLVDKNADNNIKLIAYATYKALLDNKIACVVYRKTAFSLMKEVNMHLDGGCKVNEEDYLVYINKFLNWIEKNSDKKTDLPFSHIGDERFKDWIITYDSASVTLAYIAAGKEAKRIIDFYINNPKIWRLGGIIEAICVKSPVLGEDWSVRAGSNLWMRIASFHLYKKTQRERYLEFSKKIADFTIAYPYATLPEAIIGHEFKTPKKGNLSVIGVAWAILTLKGYDPLVPPGSENQLPLNLWFIFCPYQLMHLTGLSEQAIRTQSLTQNLPSLLILLELQKEGIIKLDKTWREEILNLLSSQKNIKSSHFLCDGGRREKLIEKLKDAIFFKALDKLGELTDELKLKRYLADLKDKNSYVRQAAIYALEEIKSPKAIEALIEALEDKNSDVRKAAFNALDKLG